MAKNVFEKLAKCRASIAAHIARGEGLGSGERPNWRGCWLVDRYNDLKDQAIQVGGHSNPEWRAYCDRFGAAYSHNGYDLFA